MFHWGCDVQGGYELDLNSPKVWEFLAGTAAGANGTNAFGQQRGYTIAPTGTTLLSASPLAVAQAVIKVAVQSDCITPVRSWEYMPPHFHLLLGHKRIMQVASVPSGQLCSKGFHSANF